jgi:hypothetical protein
MEFIFNYFYRLKTEGSKKEKKKQKKKNELFVPFFFCLSCVRVWQFQNAASSLERRTSRTGCLTSRGAKNLLERSPSRHKEPSKTLTVSSTPTLPTNPLVKKKKSFLQDKDITELTNFFLVRWRSVAWSKLKKRKENLIFIESQSFSFFFLMCFSSQGNVQEEILFLIKPECLVSMLFCTIMESREAIYILGAERYSSYSGYGWTMNFSGSFPLSLSCSLC